MDVVTCNGSQFLNIKIRSSDVGKDYIGFKYLKTTDLIKSNMFSFISNKNKLVGVLKYSVEVREHNGLLGALGVDFLYIRLYFMDIRSDKRGTEREDICELLLEEFCDVINTFKQSKKIINISTFKGYDFDSTVESVISSNVDKVKFIKKGRKKYGR